MNISNSEFYRGGWRFFLAVIASFAFISATSAQSLTWDPNALLSGSLGGNGYWNTTNTNWYDSAADADVAWGSDTGNTTIANLVLSTAPNYTITLATPIYAGGLSMIGTGATTYTLTGSGPLILNGLAPTIAVSSGQIATYVDIQSSNGLIKSGGGNLRLVKAQSYVGTTTLAAGNLNLGVNNGLPTGTVLNITASGAQFFLQGFNQTIEGLTGVGNVRNTTGGTTSTLTISSASATTFSGQISDNNTVNGSKLALVLTNSGRLVLTNSAVAASYNGGTLVEGGATLALGKSLTGTGSVTLAGGTISALVSGISLGGNVAVNAGGVLRVRDASTPGAVNLVIANGSTFTLDGGEIDFTLGTSSDSITGSGGAFSLISGTIALTLGTGFDYGSNYDLLTGFSGSSTFDDTQLNVTGISSQYEAVWTFNSGTGTLNVSFVSVPEPTTYALILSGMLMQLLMWRVAHRRKAVA